MPTTTPWTAEARQGLSDLQFTGRYRVPFQFAGELRRHLPVPAVAAAAEGLRLQDLDGVQRYDLAGSYGVNLLGVDAYREMLDEAAATARALGPTLGVLHPCVTEVLARLRAISGHEEASFHMSGTEAVMQAVRLARYHTGRRYLVRFSGAYHGWWEDVQPGPGNPSPVRETYTLADMDERTLQVLRTRRDIACVLVNPLQAMHPNRPAPADSALVDGRRLAGADRAAYVDWLRRLRAVCSERGIVLIFDEVFVGFRLARGGAQAWSGVQADLVTYGKTLGGGLPVGVVCGPHRLMKRWREDRPVDVCFARGTFNAHPMVMAAMLAFLRRLDRPEVLALYDGLDERWDRRAAAFNAALEAAGLPLRIAHLSSIWAVQYLAPSRYHWMLQFYLRAHGLHLSWVGTGRLIFSLAYGEADMAAVRERFVAAAQEMEADGWWWQGEGLSASTIRRGLLREMLARRFGRGAR
ncbi:aminotransferase class III-fold pyridoxal phosphate-dependent enzyme [Piscinibacter sakaiensis]|uniref:aminotransferase class III-fold pyridoxal phosphate-dependent enzyme n=1 Tax=Piscinibacter sakaiensis TaxID=1547922 RepID=UPI00372C8625